MPISEFTAPMGPSATIDRLNELVSAVNTLTGAAATVQDKTYAFYPRYLGMSWYDLEGAPGSPYNSDAGLLELLYEGSGGRNYYDWSSGDGSSQSVNGSFQWQVPSVASADASGPWQETNAIRVAVWTTDSSGADLDLVIRRGSTQVATASNQVSAAAWSYVSFSRADISGTGWAAGDKLTIEVTLTAAGTDHVRLGEILLAVREVT